MKLLIDAGNSTIACGITDSSLSFVSDFKFKTDLKKSSDEYTGTLEELLKVKGINRSEIDEVAISSVVPNLNRALEKMAYNVFGFAPYMLTLSSPCCLVRESIPSELGTDILANLAAAHVRFPNDFAMTVDFGTALTFSTVSPRAEVMGVAIAPGLVTAVNSLAVSTAQLNQIQLKTPGTALGRNSEESVRAGVMYGWAGIAREIIKRTEEELGEKVRIILTGGLSRTMYPLIREEAILDPFHTLSGIGHILSCR